PELADRHLPLAGEAGYVGSSEHAVCIVWPVDQLVNFPLAEAASPFQARSAYEVSEGVAKGVSGGTGQALYHNNLGEGIAVFRRGGNRRGPTEPHRPSARCPEPSWSDHRRTMLFRPEGGATRRDAVCARPSRRPPCRTRIAPPVCRHTGFEH